MWNSKMNAPVLVSGLVFALFFATGLFANSGTAKDIVRNYEWEYEGEAYGLSYRIPWKTYDFYEGKPRVYHNYAVYSYENPDYEFIAGFAAALAAEAKAAELNSWQTIAFITAFVQQLSYEKESGEYPKFPVETLVDKGGDCEDTSILLATILDRLGYDVLLVNPPGHMAVALACNNCDGPAYEKDGRKYILSKPLLQVLK